MKGYHKIETVFTRDENKKLTRTFRNPTVEYLKDNDWYFTEKIDGMNIRVYWDGHEVRFAGRTDSALIPNKLMQKLEEYFGGETNAQMFEQTFGEMPVMLIGEGYGAKIQNGEDYVEDGISQDFVLFDVLVNVDLRNEKYLSFDDVRKIGALFNLKCVPIMYLGTLMRGIELYGEKDCESMLAPLSGKLIEGVVARPAIDIYDENKKRIIVKIKRRDFIQ